MNIDKIGQQHQYSSAFLATFASYPHRDTSHNKKAAWRAWQARLRSGAKPDVIAAGVARYKAYCEAEGSVGTKYVKMAQTFFGADEHYLSDWKISRQAKQGQAPKSDEQWVKYGESIGKPARMGESMHEYIGRLREEFNKR